MGELTPWDGALAPQVGDLHMGRPHPGLVVPHWRIHLRIAIDRNDALRVLCQGPKLLVQLQLLAAHLPKGSGVLGPEVSVL